MNPLFRTTSLALLFLLLGTPAWSAEKGKTKENPTHETDDDLKADLKKLQGKWEYITGSGGRRVKEIKGNKETMTVYDFDDSVKRQWTIVFNLEKAGPVKLFTYAGSEESLKDNDRCTSFIYHVDEDVFYDVPGLLHGRRSYSDHPAMYEWYRIYEEGDEEKSEEKKDN